MEYEKLLERLENKEYIDYDFKNRHAYYIMKDYSYISILCSCSRFYDKLLKITVLYYEPYEDSPSYMKELSPDDKYFDRTKKLYDILMEQDRIGFNNWWYNHYVRKDSKYGR